MSKDTVIIGGGPAGLACARVLADQGRSCLVLEMGERHPLRGPVNGLGGAGLYSDGKFSFWPSGTALWQLLPPDRLENAYNMVRQWVESASGEDLPSWRNRWIFDPDLPGEGPLHKH